MRVHSNPTQFQPIFLAVDRRAQFHSLYIFILMYFSYVNLTLVTPTQLSHSTCRVTNHFHKWEAQSFNMQVWERSWLKAQDCSKKNHMKWALNYISTTNLASAHIFLCPRCSKTCSDLLSFPRFVAAFTLWFQSAISLATVWFLQVTRSGFLCSLMAPHLHNVIPKIHLNWLQTDLKMKDEFFTPSFQGSYNDARKNQREEGAS